MIPYLAVLKIRGRSGRRIHLWIPLALVWILLLPVALLALPLFFLFCLVGRVSLVRAANTLEAVFGGLRGTRVDVEDRSYSVSLRIA
jgi:hypothetical protein